MERENTRMWWVEDNEAVSNHSNVASPRPSCRAFVELSLCVILGLALPGWSQTSDANSNQNQSWTSTSENHDSNVGSTTRTSESHTKNGNRSVDNKTVEILRSGSYEPYQETERETTQVDASTTRTTVRTYGRDSNGNRILTQVTDEEKRDSSGGSKVVRTTSNPDANGRLAVVQRQVEDTNKVGANSEVIKTTTYLPGGNGGLVPTLEVQERRDKVDDHTTKFQKSTMLSDGNGNWQVGERKDGTITDDGKNRSSEEQVARQDGSGNLSEVSRTVSRESRGADGQSQSVVETYSKDVPGNSPDGTMRLVQRVTASRNSSDGNQTTRQQVQQVSPANPSDGLQVTVGSTGSERSAAGGTSATNTVETRDADGRMKVVSVDMTKSDKTPAVQVQITPPSKPK